MLQEDEILNSTGRISRWRFLDRVRRDFDLAPCGGGFGLGKPGGRRFGCARFSIALRNAGLLKFYVYNRHFDQRRRDPCGPFEHHCPSSPPGVWTCPKGPAQRCRRRVGGPLRSRPPSAPSQAARGPFGAAAAGPPRCAVKVLGHGDPAPRRPAFPLQFLTQGEHAPLACRVGVGLRLPARCPGCAAASTYRLARSGGRPSRTERSGSPAKSWILLTAAGRQRRNTRGRRTPHRMARIAAPRVRQFRAQRMMHEKEVA